MQKRGGDVPVFQLPLVIVELDSPGMLHAPHDVGDVLLVDHHLPFHYLKKTNSDRPGYSSES